LDRRL
jgi:hypothetical protein